MRILVGDVRVVKRFLLRPLILGDEMRWLEWVFVIQGARKVERPVIRLADVSQNSIYEMRWIDLEFTPDGEI